MRRRKGHNESWLSSLYLDAQDFPRLAFRKYFERTATHLAIGRESLCPDTRVNHEFKTLPAKRALNGFGCFHVSACFLA
jgi:hypothetical protein